MSDTVFKRTKKELTQKHTGVNNAHQSPLLTDGLKYKTITGSMKDLEFIKGMKLNHAGVPYKPLNAVLCAQGKEY